MKSKPILFPVCLSLAITLVVTATGCNKPEAPPVLEKPMVRVEVEAVTQGTIKSPLRLAAEIKADRYTKLASGLSGRIDAVLVDEGQWVKSGQLLARINAGLVSAQHAQAEAVLKTAESNLKRIKTLADRKLTSAVEVERSELQLAEANAALAMARAQLKNAYVKAPHAGVIAKRHVNPGESAGPASPLFDLVDHRRVKVVAQLPEKKMGAIAVGTAATVWVDALGAEGFSAKVTRVGTVAMRYSRTFDLEMAIDNPELKLKPGMLARIEIVQRVTEDVPVVRRDAVVESLEGPSVFVLTDELVRQRPVELGDIEGARVAVVGGLAVGEQIVTVGQRALVDKQPVKVVRLDAEAPAVADAPNQPGTP